MVNDLAPLSQPTGSIVDWALAAGVALSIVVGAFRGLIREVMALLGWGVSYFSAQWWGVPVAQSLPVGAPGSQVNALAGMALVFILTWLAWALLTWALREVLTASGLGSTDRLLGGVFGLLRGLLVALVVYTLVGMTPLAQWSEWQSARSLPWLQTLLTGLRPMLPERILEFLPASPSDGSSDPSIPCDRSTVQPCKEEVI